MEYGCPIPGSDGELRRTAEARYDATSNEARQVITKQIKSLSETIYDPRKLLAISGEEIKPVHAHHAWHRKRNKPTD